MVINVSEGYKTFDKKHNLEEIDNKNTLKALIKSSKNEGINKDYSCFSSFFVVLISSSRF